MNDELIITIIALFKSFSIIMQDFEEDIKILTKTLTKYYTTLQQNKQII